MNFSTKNIAASRVSNMVTINHVEYNPNIRSILAHCSDNNTRTCRIDRCESLPAARLLFKETKALVGMSAFFYAAGGNDPSRWFFAVEGVKPVYDDTPDYIHGMRVDEPDYEDECDLSDEVNPSEITQVDKHTVQLTGQALLDYIAFRFPKEVEEVAEMETAEEGAMSALAQHEAEVDVVVEASVAVTWLLVRYNFLFAEGNQTWADWAQLRHDLVMAKHTLESNKDYELSNTIEEKLGNIKFIINDIEAKTLLLELEEQR